MTRTLALFAAAALGACASPKPAKSPTLPGQEPGEQATSKPPKGVTTVAPPAKKEPKAKTVDPQEVAFLKKCDGQVAAAKKMLPQVIAARAKRTVDNTLVPYNLMMIHADNADQMAGLMEEVHPNPDVREVARSCEQEAEAFMSRVNLNRKVYEAFKAVKTAGLDANAKRFVAHTLRDFRRAGVDKDAATRAHLKKLDARLVELSQQFSKNIADDTRSIAVRKSDLKGLPADYIAAHKPGNDGKIHITTDYPDYYPFEKYAASEALRKKLYIAFNNRAGKANDAVLRKILELRDEKAKILGYKNWADYITADKMIKSGKHAAAFIKRVARLARRRARHDYRVLLRAKRRDYPHAKHLDHYDWDYYADKVGKEKYHFDPQAVRPYFTFNEVLNGILHITSTLYGITYKPVPNAPVWHPDVKVYDVMQSGKKIGRIYLDMHPRKDKYKHDAEFTLQTGVKGVQLPVGVLVCNLPDPAKESPALMEHDDVVTMFHEFGHLMNDILGGHHRWIDQSGIATEWDFVEAPAEMFEKWAWTYDVLKLFARNYETGKVIPKRLVERMRRAHKFGIGLRTEQQIVYSAISLDFHALDPKKLNFTNEVEKLQEEYTPIPFVKGTHMEASFGHLDDYTALYYTYEWSQMIAEDLLTPFERHGFMNVEVAHHYRDTVLVPGGTEDAAVLVHNFLGRDFNFKAFERYLNGVTIPHAR